MPVRRCAVCRRTAEQRELLRVVKRGEEVVLDLAGTASGRGAYLHLEQACLFKRGALEAVLASLAGSRTVSRANSPGSRALRQGTEPSLEQLVRQAFGKSVELASQEPGVGKRRIRLSGRKKFEEERRARLESLIGKERSLPNKRKVMF